MRSGTRDLIGAEGYRTPGVELEDIGSRLSDGSTMKLTFSLRDAATKGRYQSGIMPSSGGKGRDHWLGPQPSTVS